MPEVIYSQSAVMVKEKIVETPSQKENYLNELVGQGEWDSLEEAQAFHTKSPEGQIQLITKAMDVRLGQLVKHQILLLNGDETQRAAAMGVTQRINELKSAKAEMLTDFYSGYRRSIGKTAGQKVEFDK